MTLCCSEPLPFEPMKLICVWILPNPQEIFTSEETYLSKLKMLDEVRNIPLL